MDPISLYSSISSVGNLPTGIQTPAGAKGEGFGSALTRALEGVNDAQKKADHLAKEFQLENPEVSLEEAVIASQKANIAFQSLLQARNKVVSAYQEIMNMPV